MAKEFKRGALSEEDRNFISYSVTQKLPVLVIAEKLNRNPQTIQRYIDDHIRPAQPASLEEVDVVEKKVIRQELRATKAWKNLKEEFRDGELEYFEESYIKLMSQFKDVLASEETQIFQAVKFEILMSRNLKERKKALMDIDRLERMQGEFLKQFNNNPAAMTDQDRTINNDLEIQLNTSRQNEQSRTGEFVKLQERHDKLMNSLKGTRDQRIKEIEKVGTDLISVIKQLSKRDVAEREGRQFELLKMAGKNAHKELGKPTQYEDGSFDCPILSPETVSQVEQEEFDTVEPKTVEEMAAALRSIPRVKETGADIEPESEGIL